VIGFEKQQEGAAAVAAAGPTPHKLAAKNQKKFQPLWIGQASTQVR
jgi:hypothetical protein